MKAVVIYKNEKQPRCADFQEPKVQADDQLLVSVKAVAVTQYEKARATGAHYSSDISATEATVVGGDGVFVLDDGTRVYATSVSGSMAEKAIIDKKRMVKIPDNVDDVTAAALPNAVIGAAMGLRFKADIQKGDVVLINGATGFTGRVAVQLAKYYGAKTVIVTGRSAQSLQDLLSLGADKIISLLQTEEELSEQLKAIHSETPFNVIVDYLWGRSAEIILDSLKGKGAFTTKTKYVSVGSLAGDSIQLSAMILRSVDLQLSGSGLGSWSKPQVHLLMTEILPEMFAMAAEGKLKVETVAIGIESIEQHWDTAIPDGKRLVVVI
ncbi:zinc-binding alcohol dehydrogenase family protein [Dyadobacter sp. CY345]|uniref:quinone oxidoreductase family protein n=1 Tax=Dyadobacter sp. CY345 TaxID=2909335 RepID=UPI001F20CF00|nr:zinc-binding alcohol dehydrogenase family protein [Dyadobacter sp. CY345]MCF2443982.1 zinc-binding alcohol dehydrogenase family protein [Dyadobacter sp. CY345]